MIYVADAVNTDGNSESEKKWLKEYRDAIKRGQLITTLVKLMLYNDEYHWHVDGEI